MQRTSLAKIRTILANHRTFLAYCRTALAFIIGGLAMIHYLNKFHSIYPYLGSLLVFIGVVCFSYGILACSRISKQIQVITKNPPHD